MKAKLLDLLADLKAAARIGSPSSLDVALDGWRAWPEVASNQGLGGGQIVQMILPVGKALAEARVAEAWVQQLARDPLAALRAAAAVALFHQGARSESFPADLIYLAGDPRLEPRRAVALAMAKEPLTPALRSLLRGWLGSKSPRVQATALWGIVELATHERVSYPELAEFERLLSETPPQPEAYDLSKAYRQAAQVLASMRQDSPPAV